MSNAYLRGSEWIKCDLHVHTPYSIINHYVDNKQVETWEKFIVDLENLPEEFKIIGINDYLFIDGYVKVLEYKLVPDYVSNESDWGGVINRENIIQLGQKLIDSSNGQLTGSPLKIGFQSLNISYDDLMKKLGKPRLKDKFLTAVGKTEWDTLRWESSPAEKKNVINKANFVSTASETIDAFDKAREKLTSQNVNNLLLDCSDAHSFSNATHKDRIGNCYTWVKINPTFNGLKYLTYEPEDRIFIGDNLNN